MKYMKKTHNTACRADACTGHGRPSVCSKQHRNDNH